MLKILLAIFMIFTLGNTKDLIFATYPSNTPEKLISAFTPLKDELQKKLNQKINLIVTKDYDELSKGLQDGSIDIAWIGSSNYVKTRKELENLKYIATYLEKDAQGKGVTPFYYSVIISLKKSKYQNLEDLIDVDFAFTDTGSTSGYAYPMLMLKRANINPEEKFKKIYFLKKHDKVIEALVEGSIDVGAVSDGTYANAIKKYGDIFALVHKSSPIPLDPIVASPKVDKNLLEKIRSILTSIEEKSPINSAIEKHLGWKASGFMVKEDNFYDDIEEALTFIK